jgi:YesN/AraC family two-component response regulator
MLEYVEKLKNYKILFVEDETSITDIISSTFIKLDINFLTAVNGEEALKELHLHNDIDLVITDINMPVMNGLDMIREAQKIKNNLKFIIMSAHTEKDYFDTAKELNVTDYIVKPFDFMVLLKIVDKY